MRAQTQNRHRDWILAAVRQSDGHCFGERSGCDRRQLHWHIAAVLKLPDVHERLAAAEFDIVGNSPSEFGYFIRSQLETNQKVIKTAGLKAE